MVIIGLTGENCAGKGTLADYLMTKGFRVFSLSDVIREELAAEGKAITRETLTAKGNELRREFGPGVLAMKVLSRVKGGENCAIDSIRNPAEVEELRKREGFFLVHVVARPEVRFERMRKRGREGDPHTLDAFLRIEAAEASSPDPAQQQLIATARLADRTISNDTDLQEFYAKVDALLAELGGGERDEPA